MPKITHSLTDGTIPQESILRVILGGVPFIVANVSRKVNTGNFENIDIGLMVGLPVPVEIEEGIEVLKQGIKDAASEAFSSAAREVQIRYEEIKSLRNADRGRQTETP